MTYIQNHTLLGSLQDYNHVLQDLQNLLKKEKPSGIQKELVDYFKNAHGYIDDLLQAMKKDLIKADAETFNQYTLNTHPLEDLESHLLMPEDSAEWIEWVLQRQQYMAEWCEGIAEQSISSRTTEVFGQIAEHLQEMNRQLARDTQAYLQESKKLSS
jgi:hypothetical protein